MRLITWNINGVRTLPQYHPWNTLKTFDNILSHLEADIICFQEMKSGRKLLTKAVAVPPSFDSFFSFPIKKTGYSGVATYTRSEAVVPLKAEEGLSGILQPKPPLTPEERISKEANYPPKLLEDLLADEDEDELDYKQLDSEGRAVVLDFGLFVLINTYCPNNGTGTEERDKFKMAYHRMLEARVKGLIEREKREVIVVGDLNACAAVIDHCEGHLMVAKGHTEGLEGEEGFWGPEYRRWIRDWLQDENGTGGYMVDIVRRFWPGRQGMYTCWNTKISARDSNYGTRIDFILITPGLLPWIKAADTQPRVKGSDHCPVYVDFHDEIVDESGNTVKLSEVLGAQSATEREPPRLAAKFWDEFSGKQTSLQQFFGNQRKGSNAPSSSQNSSSSTPAPTFCTSPDTETLVESQASLETPASSQSSLAHTAEDTPSRSTTQVRPSAPPSSQGSGFMVPTKRKLVADYASHPKKAKKEKPSQASIASFFSKPPASSSKSTNSNGKGKAKARAQEQPIELDLDTEDEDYKLAVKLSQEQEQETRSSPPPTPSSSQSRPDTESECGAEKSKQVWSALLAPIQPPKCRGHGEAAKEFTVNKPGPNKGKKFFICSRPVGPGYDKGRSERLREHVDPQYRCDFFKWSSDVRKEMMKNGQDRS